MRKDFNYLCHVCVKEGYKMYTFLYEKLSLACKGQMFKNMKKGSWT